MSTPNFIEPINSKSPTSTFTNELNIIKTNNLIDTLNKNRKNSKTTMNVNGVSSYPLLTNDTNTTTINGEEKHDFNKQNSLSPSPPNNDNDNPFAQKIPIISKPRSPSRSKSKSRQRSIKERKRRKSKPMIMEQQMIEHTKLNTNNNNNENGGGLKSPSHDIMDSLRSDDEELGFPDMKHMINNNSSDKTVIVNKSPKKKEAPTTTLATTTSSATTQIITKQERSYYLEHTLNENMQYSYFHSRIKDKLVWYEDIEKLLPSTIPGQFIYGLLNMIFSADLYYSFHRYSFDDGFKSEHRMDDFFTSRRVLSIQRTIPDILPSILWYKIIKYEPTPYKSMCYYQYVRQNDADKRYKIPVILGYLQMIVLVILTFVFALNLDNQDIVSRKFFNFNLNEMINNFPNQWTLLFSKNGNWLNWINILCFSLLFITILHIILIMMIWRMIWFLHPKIKDWKQRIYRYLSRRRKKEVNFIDNIYGENNKNKIQQEYKYRIYYKINHQSYLYFKRNGELFISLLKWLNVVEYEGDLDFFTTSTRNWFIITFGLHKYLFIILYCIILLFGINTIILLLIFLFFFSYWVHCIELYNGDHHNLASKSNQDYIPNDSCCYSVCCNTIYRKILKFLVWPGILFYIILSYCIYTITFHTDYFIVIWFGIAPIWLIIYSVLTRGYRRIYMFNGLSLFMLYFVTISYHLEWKFFLALFLCLFIFFIHLSLQFEMHRAMLFPQMSADYKYNESAQNKFGLDVNGAKLYTFVQYAASYFRKTRGIQSNNSNNNRRYNNYHKKEHSRHNSSYSNINDDYNYINHYNININGNGFASEWYNKWYIQLPFAALKVPKPEYAFVYKGQ